MHYCLRKWKYQYIQEASRVHFAFHSYSQVSGKYGHKSNRCDCLWARYALPTIAALTNTWYTVHRRELRHFCWCWCRLCTKYSKGTQTLQKESVHTSLLYRTSAIGVTQLHSREMNACASSNLRCDRHSVWFVSPHWPKSSIKKVPGRAPFGPAHFWLSFKTKRLCCKVSHLSHSGRKVAALLSGVSNRQFRLVFAVSPVAATVLWVHVKNPWLQSWAFCCNQQRLSAVESQ